MNKVVLIGRLTKDPELKYTPGSGTAVTTITLAVDRRFSKDNQREADFIPVVIWGKSAESTAQYMSKGKLMSVAGRIQTRSYEAKDGGRRYVTEVVAEEVKFLEWGNKTQGQNGGFAGNDEPGYGASFDDMTPIDDGDIPF
ncbi:single-stranded DNA-binding protein [Proteiniclasticum sp. BAD-10]|jgi:single-strand DNA-binding protein|uniref:Single-stranded DNA-binding protein n=1 Tax=Proteiniclasticum sediminis TaxID=2804028 RepID=A0A941CQU7_9CLOT|nr:single-stranded DNA-binding protein [Proteiniclasticum sediminis]MBR0576557.1 single-stranded DNA-binding protein [Proteiniclasticum sediminis]